MKKWIAALAAVLAVVLVYGYVWLGSYKMAVKYYDQAEENMNKQRYDIALKGDEAYNRTSKKYEYVGGYEQVLSIWKSPYAWPRPAVYDKAKDKIDEIVNDKLTPEAGVQLVQKYLRQDNAFLPEILVSSTKKLIEQDRKDEAKDVLDMLSDAFGSQPGMQEQIEALNAKLK
ncbi:hypothetical protein [Cohnella candidum]|uniref:Uncharacterized protein n=1 Tax=Cohnella candidum TaxID=2674991 RepID=A0A3G3K4D5_9BACL|nr:hypothetical protein [Cohnella candidum]AYQ74907.1 hypothetical protein EAV92_21540 [Cohnella candidum]